MNIFRTIIRVATAITIITLSFTAVSTTPAQAFTVGPNSPTVATNVGTIGTEAWTTPEEIIIPGGAYASVLLYQGHTVSNYLQATGYGFALPADVVVYGIQLDLNRMASDHNPSIHDNMVSLVKGGVVVGENKASSVKWPKQTFALATYGGIGDLWGTDWTVDDVNSPDFGAALAAFRDNNGNNPRYGNVDFMQITVWYGYPTSTTVECGNGTAVVYGDSVVCQVTVTRLASDLTPTGNVSFTSDGDGAFDPNPCTLSGADGVATCTTTYTPLAVGTGLHTITAAYNADDFFAISSGTDELTVDARPITFTADPQAKLYGDPDPELTYEITEGSLVYSDTITGTLTREPGEDVGQYAILQGTLAINPNYLITYVGDFLTISPRLITITADPVSKLYGETDPELTYQITSGELLPGDVISGTLEREPGEAVGTYAIMLGSLTLPAYYELTFVSADFTINPLQITITADALSKRVGEPDPVLTYQITSGELLPGDTISGALEREPGEAVGSYDILIGTLSLPAYYDLTFVGAEFKITGSRILIPFILRTP